MFVYPRGIHAFWNFRINFCSVLFNKTILLFSLSENQVVFENSVDLVDMSHYAEFPLALHCLQMYVAGVGYKRQNNHQF